MIFIIAQSKEDLGTCDVTEKDVSDAIEEFGVNGTFVTSAKTNHCIKELFEDVAVKV